MTESFDSDDPWSVDLAERRANKLKKYRRGQDEHDTELMKEQRRGDRLHGRRPVGRQDLTDIPTGMAQQLMGREWRCPNCATSHMGYTMNCVTCGFKSPLGAVNWRR